MSASRSNWTDYTTGLCILLFVMAQSAASYAGMTGQAHWMEFVQAWSEPIIVPMLFVTAGMFVPRTVFGSKSTFFDRKVLRFVYFYLVWLIIQTAILHGFTGSNGLLGLVEEFALGLVQPAAGLWILPLLALFGLATWLVRLATPLKILTGAALLQILHAAGLIQTGWLLLDGFAQYFVFFFAGYAGAALLRRFADAVGKRASDIPAALGIWAVINMILVVQGTASLPVISLILGLAGAVALIAVGVLLAGSRHAAFLHYAGRNHLVIYVAYFVPLTIAQYLLTLGSFRPEPGLTSLGIAVAAIAVSLGLHHLLRMTPLKALYRRPKALRLKGSGLPRGGQLIGASYDSYDRAEEA